MGCRTAEAPGAGRASRGGRVPAELTACVCPRMLCLARNTDSRLTIIDSTVEEKEVIL